MLDDKLDQLSADITRLWQSIQFRDERLDKHWRRIRELEKQVEALKKRNRQESSPVKCDHLLEVRASYSEHVYASGDVASSHHIVFKFCPICGEKLCPS